MSIGILKLQGFLNNKLMIINKRKKYWTSLLENNIIT